ncbi:FAD dependent oxidoreductase [Peziza echinospora]|nr:FAD dependent oxidoreductase [Peziza echinospora]
MTVMPGQDKKNIVIIGGGIIGCTTAYYLTRHPSYDPKIHSITLIEATRIAGGASGKAGGLLAVWAYPSYIVGLSFKLHEELANEHGGEEHWGYRRVTCGDLEAQGRDWSDLDGANLPRGHPLGKRRKGGVTGRPTGVPEDLDWIVPELIQDYEEIGDTSATAQVHPYQFTLAMLDLAKAKGVKVIIGSVTDLKYTDIPGTSNQMTPPPSEYQNSDPSSPNASSTSLSSDSSTSLRRRAVIGVTYTDPKTEQSVTIPSSTTILAAGPWTSKLYPSAPISGLRAHSVTITPTEPVSAYALFTKINIPQAPNSQLVTPRTRSGSRSPPAPERVFASPEIYARPTEIYVCGEGDMDVPLPASTAEVEVDEARCDELISQVASISDHIREGIVTRKQACYLPIVNIGGSGGPLIGETGTEGLLLASGHSCWGINNAPATGVLMAEIVFDGKAKSADIRTMDPRRIL